MKPEQLPEKLKNVLDLLNEYFSHGDRDFEWVHNTVMSVVEKSLAGAENPQEFAMIFIQCMQKLSQEAYRAMSLVHSAWIGKGVNKTEDELRECILKALGEHLTK